MDWLNVDLSDIFSNKNRRGLGDFHLRSALLLVDWEKLSKGKGRSREQRAARIILNNFRDHKIVCDYPINLMISLKDQKLPALDIPCKDELIEILSQEIKALNKLLSDGDLLIKSVNVLKEENFNLPDFFLRKLLIICLMTVMAKTSERSIKKFSEIKFNQKRGCDKIKIGNVNLFLFGELIGYTEDKYINTDGKVLHLLSLDSFRMIVDKFTERSNVLISTIIGNNVLPDIYPSLTVIKTVFNLFDNYLRTKRNDGYKFLKAYEAIITGIILKKKNCLYWNNSEFLENTLKEFGTQEKRIAMILEHIANLPGTTIHHLTQLMGLFRLWGHPVVNAEKGVEKVRKVGTADKSISTFYSEIAGCKFMEIFFINYFKKNGYYPPVEVTKEDNLNYLQTTIKKDLPINLKDPGYTLLDWDNIKVQKCFGVPSSFNLSMIVADTAISPTRSEMYEIYNNDSMSSLDPSVRRGVLKWMKDGVLDCATLLSEVNSNPFGLDKDHRIIGLYQKERELNPVARMFALMSLLMRAYVVVTEALLADHILPLVPGITMTYSMLHLTKEMIKTTWRQRNPAKDSVTFCINMDFEKWNLNMRKESTIHVFKNLGRIFGLSELFNRTYDIFSNSIIYLADGSYRLSIDNQLNLTEENPDFAYEGHMGGFEGLRQKGWTIFTVSLIQYCCDNLGVDWKLMGQGDNQVLLVTIYSRYSRSEGINSNQAIYDINSKLRELLELMFEVFGKIGLPLKPLETWVSDSFFSYGKFPIYQGLPCAMSLKKISRIFFFSNEDIMTLDNAMGSIVTNSQSAAMSDVHPCISYIIAKWQQLMCLRLFMYYHPLIGESPLRDARKYKFTMSKGDNQRYIHSGKRAFNNKVTRQLMISFPKTLGGLNSVTYFDMIMRGFSDPPTMDYQWLFEMSNQSEGELRRGFENLKSLMINTEKNYSYLLQDPVGLNLYVPTSSSQAIKQMIHRVIEGMPSKSVFSLWFKEIMKVSDPVVIQELSSELTESGTLNIRFLHDILGSTIFGYCDSIASKVDKTVTLTRIAWEQEDVVGKVIENERRFINYLYWRIETKGNLRNIFSCPSKYIRYARFKGWDKRLEGVSVPFPYHYLSRNREESDRQDSYLTGTVDDCALSYNTLTLNTIGRALPYLGSVTKEKLPASSVRLAFGTEPLVNRPIRLLRSIGWFVQSGSNFEKLLRRLVSAVTDINIDQLIIIPDKVKGCMVHRYSDFAIKHGSLWLPLYGPATFINLSTNDFHEYSRGSKNVSLHFQATLCYFQFLIISNILSDEKEKLFKLWRCCKDCVTSISDDFEDLPKEINYKLIPSRPENPYLFLNEDDISLEIKREESMMRSIKKASVYDLENNEVIVALTDWLAIRLANSIIYQDADELEGGLLDVVGVSRTLYLKIHPHNLLNRLIKFLIIILATGNKYKGKFPTIDLMRLDIKRTLGRSSSRNYGIFSGYYLWPESQSILQQYGASFPETYPATPQSVADASKRTIIRFVQNCEKVKFNKKAYVMQGYESHVISLLKAVALRRLEKSSNDHCDYCIKTLMTTRFITQEGIEPILIEKCELGHHLTTLSDINNVYYLPDINIDSAADFLPNFGVHNFSISHELRINTTDLFKMNSAELLLDERDLNFSDHFRLNERVSIKKMENNPIEFCDQLFNHPTRGFYRMIEILIQFKSVRKGNLLVIGDGFGMSSLAASSTSKAKYKITSWTYIEPSSGISHSLRESKPPAFYNFSNDINISPTFDQIGDVSHPKFEKGFSKIIEENHISRVVSDIEWWYLGSDYTSKLIRLCKKYKVQEFVCRLFINNLDDVYEILEQANYSYSHWSVSESKNVSLVDNELLLYCNSPRFRIDPLGYLTVESREKISMIMKSVTMRLERSLSQQQKLIINLVDNQLVKHSIWMKWVEDMCSNWFNDAEIDGWNSPSFTTLFNNLKTGRKPISVKDLIGRDIYYMRDSWRNQAKMRLLALALSLVEDPIEVSSALSDYWDLQWDLSRTNETFKGTIQYNIKLTRECVKRLPDHKESTTISHYAGLIKATRMRKSFPIEFRTVGQVIEFKYVPKHINAGTDVFFRISKNASYSLPGIIYE